MIKALHKMGVKSSMMYGAGLASIGLSFATWYVSLSQEKAGLDRADRWGIFIGEWAPTFFAMGVALRIEETHEGMEQGRGHGMEMTEGTYAEGMMPSRAGV
ncbi:hypothetical protein ACWDTT_28545 [Streptosporangium sandarakinum]|uniref:Uncharacterized protein n=1 Tax=Streptosporangium sandarakinum TaxID=1260955 RepID=A0A852V2S5_9ACTN|nr:hypothetical protein [Streptosporangium sandarakinum]NYF41958.1 hypothetical protein [Streptosporangium sandarakinum]